MCGTWQKIIRLNRISTPNLAVQAHAAPPIPMVAICMCVCPTSIGRSSHPRAPTQSWREVRHSKNVQKKRVFHCTSKAKMVKMVKNWRFLGIFGIFAQNQINEACRGDYGDPLLWLLCGDAYHQNRASRPGAPAPMHSSFHIFFRKRNFSAFLNCLPKGVKTRFCPKRRNTAFFGRFLEHLASLQPCTGACRRGLWGILTRDTHICT